MRRGVLLAGVMLVALWLAPTAAWAHAGIVSSNPEPGAQLGSAPGVVTLRFSEPLNERLSGAEVLSPDGARFEGTPEAAGEIVVRLTTNAQGIYRVTWTTVSSVDGHTLEGSFEFGVGVRPASAEGETSTSPGLVDTSIAVARTLEDAALLLAVGLLLVRRLGRDLSWLRVPIVPALVVALAGGLAVVFGEALVAAGRHRHRRSGRTCSRGSRGSPGRPVSDSRRSRCSSRSAGPPSWASRWPPPSWPWRRRDTPPPWRHGGSASPWRRSISGPSPPG